MQGPSSERRLRWSRVRLLLRPHRRRTVQLALSSFFGGAVEAAFLVVITRTALAIADGKKTFGVLHGRSFSVGAAVAVGAVLLMVRLAFALASLRASTYLTVAVTTGVRRDLATAYLHSSWALQQAEPSGRLHELLLSFAASASGVVGSFLWLLNGLLNLAALIVVSLLINPAATLVVVGALALLGSLLAPVRSRIRTRSAAAARAQMAFASSVNELGALGMEMQAFGVRDQFWSRVLDLVDRDARARRRALLLQGALSPTYTFLAYGALLGGLGLARTVASTELGGVAAVMLVMMRSLSYGQQMQTASGSLLGSLPYLEAIDETAKRYQADPATRGDITVESVGRLSVRNVSFAYVPEHEVLRDLTFSIAAGEVIGVIGPSGSGKSTLVQLLLGLRDPTSGEIEVDDVDLRKVDRGSWTAKTSYVAQEALLLSGSIADNVTFFRDGIDRDRVRRATAQAHLADEIASLPQTYDYEVGERGSRLSGGQRQRVSIARALAGDPELLIMDEPTSALDVRSEAAIRETINELKGSVTVVIIAHRLSTLDVCDRIMVLDHGVLKAFDTRDALAQNNAFFREALALSELT